MLRDNGALLAVGVTAAIAAVAAGARSGSRAEGGSIWPGQGQKDYKMPMAASAFDEKDDAGMRRRMISATALNEADRMFFRALGFKEAGGRFVGEATPFITNAFKRRYQGGESFGLVPADGQRDMRQGLLEAESMLSLRSGTLEASGLSPAVAARVARVPEAAPVGIVDGRARFNPMLDKLRKPSDLPGAMEHRLLEEIEAWAKGYGARSVLLLGDRSTDRASWMSLGFAPLFEENGLLLAIRRLGS
jgi:hypothetical protein